LRKPVKIEALLLTQEMSVYLGTWTSRKRRRRAPEPVTGYVAPSQKSMKMLAAGASSLT
jgi:hypothetical protein